MARILFVATHPMLLWKNGADLGALELARRLQARGHDVRFRLVVLGDGDSFRAYEAALRAQATTVDGDGFVVGGVRLTPTPLPTPDADGLEACQAALLASVRQAVHDHVTADAPDGVVVHWGDYRLGRFARQVHPRVLVLVQNGEAVDGLTAELVRDLDLAVPAQRLARRLQKRLGRNVPVLLSPIAGEVAPPRPPGAEIGMVNICGEKGAVIFLNVAANLPHLRFVATGGWKGDAERFAQMATGLPNVTILPPSDDLAPFYARLRALVVPSLFQEAFGRVAVEAQLHGVPVVLSDRCGARDYVDGLVVPATPLSAGMARDEYYCRAELHERMVRGFLDAVVTLEDDDNHAELSRRARAAGQRWLGAQEASIATFERWLRPRGARASASATPRR